MKTLLALTLSLTSAQVHAVPLCESVFADSAVTPAQTDGMIQDLHRFYHQIMRMPPTDPLRARLYQDFKLRFSEVQSLTSEPLGPRVTRPPEANDSADQIQKKRSEDIAKQKADIRSEIKELFNIHLDKVDLNDQRWFQHGMAESGLQWTHDGAFAMVRIYNQKNILIDLRDGTQRSMKDPSGGAVPGFLAQRGYRFARVEKDSVTILDMSTMRNLGTIPGKPVADRRTLSDQFIITETAKPTLFGWGTPRIEYTLHDYINNRRFELGAYFNLSSNGKFVAFISKKNELSFLNLDTGTIDQALQVDTSRLHGKAFGDLIVHRGSLYFFVDMDSLHTRDIPLHSVYRNSDFKPVRWIGNDRKKDVAVFMQESTDPSALHATFVIYDFKSGGQKVLDADFIYRFSENALVLTYFGNTIVVDLNTLKNTNFRQTVFSQSSDGRFLIGDQWIYDLTTQKEHTTDMVHEVIPGKDLAIYKDFKKSDIQFGPFDPSLGLTNTHKRIGVGDVSVSPDGRHILTYDSIKKHSDSLLTIYQIPQ